MQDDWILGKRLRQRRAELGMSLDGLSAATGLHKSFLSRLEAGIVRQPGADSLSRIADGLDLPQTELFGLLDERARGSLPALQPYLRAKYDLPDDVIAEITAYLGRYGTTDSGPLDGEDEQPERTT